MTATKSDIQGWFERGVAKGASHMIVVCDTFDHDDYPVFVEPDEDVRGKIDEYSGKNMQRVMEVYRLSDDMGEQLSEHRVYRV